MHLGTGPVQGGADVGADGAGAKNSDFHKRLRSRVHIRIRYTVWKNFGQGAADGRHSVRRSKDLQGQGTPGAPPGRSREGPGGEPPGVSLGGPGEGQAGELCADSTPGRRPPPTASGHRAGDVGASPGSPPAGWRHRPRGRFPSRKSPSGSAYGRRLAEPLHALVPVPGADVAAMDGYAVAGVIRPVGRGSRAGRRGGPLGTALAPGTAVEIATGAPVPEGPRRVLPYEAAVRVVSPDVRRARTKARFRVIQPGRHIRRRGEDCPQGAVVLPAGSVRHARGPRPRGGAGARHVSRSGRDPWCPCWSPATRWSPGGSRAPAGRDAIGPMLPGLVEWAGGRAEAPLWLPDGASALAAALSGAGAGAVRLAR